MSDVRVVLESAEIDAALRRLRDFPRTEAASTMGAIARYMKTAAQMRFRNQVGPEGQRWPQSKAARARSGQTLRDSGDLFRSLTWRAGADYAEAGTNKVYAPVHQFGILKVITIRAHRRMTRRVHADGGGVSVRRSPVKSFSRLMFVPARPFLGFSQDDANAILGILAKRIAAAAAR